MGACLQLRVHTPMPPMQWEGVMAPLWVHFLISQLGRPGTIDVVPDGRVLLTHLFLAPPKSRRKFSRPPFLPRGGRR